MWPLKQKSTPVVNDNSMSCVFKTIVHDLETITPDKWKHHFSGRYHGKLIHPERKYSLLFDVDWNERPLVWFLELGRSGNLFSYDQQRILQQKIQDILEKQVEIKERMRQEEVNRKLSTIFPECFKQ